MRHSRRLGRLAFTTLIVVACSRETAIVASLDPEPGTGGAGGETGSEAGSQNGGASGRGGASTGGGAEGGERAQAGAGAGGEPESAFCTCGDGTTTVCGSDGQTYDTFCGADCPNVFILCLHACPCGGEAAGGETGNPSSWYPLECFDSSTCQGTWFCTRTSSSNVGAADCATP